MNSGLPGVIFSFGWTPLDELCVSQTWVLDTVRLFYENWHKHVSPSNVGVYINQQLNIVDSGNKTLRSGVVQLYNHQALPTLYTFPIGESIIYGGNQLSLSQGGKVS